MFFLLFFFFVLFFVLAYKNFRLAIGLFIIFLPTYLIRFSIGPLPSTVLELCFLILVLVWLIKYIKNDLVFLKKIIIKYKLLFIFITLFFLASIIGIFVSGDYFKAAGLWRAYFLEPIVLFLILLGRRQQIKGKDIILFLTLSTISISVLGIIQKFTGWEISTPEWTELATRRVTSFFSSPNAVGLYLAPLAILMLAVWPDLAKNNKYFYSLALILILLVLLFTKSEGTWIALASGLVVYIFLVGYKKIAGLILLAGIIFVVLTPKLQQAASFQDRASYNRILLWSYSWDYLSHSPSNFIFGTGLRQFYNKIQKPVHDWSKIERHIYPHNIFLNFWTEIGLLGMLSFSGIIGYLLVLVNRIRNKQSVLGAGLLSALVVLFVHGLVDVPYFKNDLSFLFWLLATLIIYFSLSQSTKISHS